jgi:hypothetical protein
MFQKRRYDLIHITPYEGNLSHVFKVEKTHQGCGVHICGYFPGEDLKVYLNEKDFTPDWCGFVKFTRPGRITIRRKSGQELGDTVEMVDPYLIDFRRVTNSPTMRRLNEIGEEIIRMGYEIFHPERGLDGWMYDSLTRRDPQRYTDLVEESKRLWDQREGEELQRKLECGQALGLPEALSSLNKLMSSSKKELTPSR